MITGNSAEEYGGGIFCDCSFPTIANSTIAGNSANRGGGIFGISAYPFDRGTIVNTIVAFNSSGIASWGGWGFLRHNCVYGNTDYNYDGLTDPRFVRPPHPGPDGVWRTADDDPGDVRLRADSPCIDAGDNAYATGDHDLDGNPRVVDGDGDGVAVVDMGAYEYSPAVAGDFDGDGDVDLLDFAEFARCFNGPGNPPAPGCAVDADLDNDGDVDENDYVIFEQSLAASGPHA